MQNTEIILEIVENITNSFFSSVEFSDFGFVFHRTDSKKLSMQKSIIANYNTIIIHSDIKDIKLTTFLINTYRKSESVLFLYVIDSQLNIAEELLHLGVNDFLTGKITPNILNLRIKQIKKYINTPIYNAEDNLIFYKQIFENYPLGIFFVNNNGQIVLSNKKVSEILGYSSEELLGKSFIDFTPKEDLEKEFALLDYFFKSDQKQTELEKRYIDKNGNFIWVKLNVVLEKILNDQLYAIINMEDITRKKNLEKELLINDNMFYGIAETTPNILYLYDLEQKRLLYINQRVEELLGYTVDELINSDFDNVLINLILPEYRERVVNEFVNWTIEGNTSKILEYEFAIHDKLGNKHWVRSYEKIFQKNENGEVTQYVGVMLDITEKVLDLQSLNQSQELFRRLFESSPIPTILAELETGKIVDVNPAYERATQYMKSELVEQTPIEVGITNYEERRRVIYAIKEQGALENFPGFFYTKNGEKRECLNYFVPITFDDKIYSIGHIIDITDIKKTHEELRKAKDQAEAANRAKSTFLANMSHEIRTPLNAILGFSDILYANTNNPEQKNFLKSIKSSGNTLLNLINDILDLSKIESGNLDIKREPGNLKTIVEEIRHVFALKIENKGISLIISIDTNIPDFMFIDELRLRQILLNLVGNAVKFTNHGYVKLSIERETNLLDGFLDLVINVEDTGIGIEEEAHSIIFDPFRQAEDDNMKKHEGSGLGLAITKRLVEMMGGNISFQSVIGKGSIFRIIIPNVKIYQQKALSFVPEEKKENTNFSFKPATILLVDDVELNRNLIKTYLNKSNLTIIEANDGKEALEKVYRYRPELILMDIRMPLMDGVTALKEIRSNKNLNSIPVIVLTAYANTTDKPKLLEMGFSGFLAKPIKRSVLITELSKHLQYNIVRENQSKQEESTILNLSKEEAINLLNLLNTNSEEKRKIFLKTKNLNHLTDFVKSLEDIVTNNQINSLKPFAAKFTEYVAYFDLENIQKSMKEYQLFYDKLNQQVL